MLFISPQKIFSFPRLIRKIKLISRFMTSQNEEKTIEIYILPTRNKGSPTLKFGQSIVHIMKNQNVVEKLFLDPVLKN